MFETNSFAQPGFDLFSTILMDASEIKSQDAGYAIYSLKYFLELETVMKEIGRIIKPKGIFIVYDMLTTDSFDEENKKHRYALAQY